MRKLAHIMRPPRHRALSLHGIQRHAGLETHIIVLAFFYFTISSFLKIRKSQMVASITV
jgi:hypothetical protein